MALDPPIPTPLNERLRDFSSGPLTVLVWFLAFVAALVLLTSRGRNLDYVGLARAVQYEVSPVMTGQVASLPVDLYEPVEAGEVVGTIWKRLPDRPNDPQPPIADLPPFRVGVTVLQD